MKCLSEALFCTLAAMPSRVHFLLPLAEYIQNGKHFDKQNAFRALPTFLLFLFLCKVCARFITDDVFICPPPSIQDSNFSTYQRMWSFMESQPTHLSVFTTSNIDGVDRVIKAKGTYAFLMESTSIEYVIERNCELTQVGGLLDSKGYGIAMPQSESIYFSNLFCLFKKRFSPS